MRCPNCGNEVTPEEAFCGQCGTPIAQPGQPTEMVNTPGQRSGLLSSFNTSMPPRQVPPSATGMPPQSGMLPPSYNPASPASPMQPAPQQQTGFYQDATEAMSALPGSGSQVFPPGYPQPGMNGQSMQGGFPPNTGQYFPPVHQPQSGTYAQPGFPQPGQFSSGQGYGYGTPVRPTPAPPEKQSTNTVLVVAIVCLVIAILAVTTVGGIYLFKSHASQQADNNPVLTATVPPTAAPSPTATPSPTPSPSPTPMPSPTLPPTPAPDPNFAWCTTTCAANGFSVEFPQGWNQDSPTTGFIRFFNPAQQDQYAGFRTPGPTTGNASDLVAGDLQNNFGTQPGYTPPTSSAATTIGGETWTYAIAHYQLNGQMERIVAYATVHQGKGYIIELQAADSQYDTLNSQVFAIMIGRFQFLQNPS